MGVGFCLFASQSLKNGEVSHVHESVSRDSIVLNCDRTNVFKSRPIAVRLSSVGSAVKDALLIKAA